MLSAQKEALHSRTRVRLQAIFGLELGLYTRNCHILAYISSVQIGFAYYGITFRASPKHGLGGHDEHVGTFGEAVYLLLLTVNLGVSMLCTLVASLTAMLGPGLALRGPDGSVALAIEQMRGFYRLALLLELLSVGLALPAAACLTYASGISVLGRALATACVLASLLLMARYARRLFSTFKLPDGPAGPEAPPWGEGRSEATRGLMAVAEPPGPRREQQQEPAAPGCLQQSTPSDERTCGAAPPDRPDRPDAARSGADGGLNSIDLAQLPPLGAPLDALLRGACSGGRSVRAAVQSLSSRVRQGSGEHSAGGGSRSQASPSRRRVAYARMDRAGSLDHSLAETDSALAADHNAARSSMNSQDS